MSEELMRANSRRVRGEKADLSPSIRKLRIGTGSARRSNAGFFPVSTAPVEWLSSRFCALSRIGAKCSILVRKLNARIRTQQRSGVQANKPAIPTILPGKGTPIFHRQPRFVTERCFNILEITFRKESSTSWPFLRGFSFLTTRGIMPNG